MIDMLRPMTLNQILDRTARLYRQNFRLLAGVASVSAIIMFCFNSLQIASVQPSAPLEPLPLHRSSALLLLCILPATLVSVAAFAAGCRAVASTLLGQPITVVQAYRSILTLLPRLCGIMLWAGLVAAAPLLLSAVVFAAVLWKKWHDLGLDMHPAAQASMPNLDTILIFAILFVLILLSVVYAIVMSLRYVLAVPACISEDLSVLGSIRRSVQLSRGVRGSIFVLFLLINALEILLLLVPQILIMPLIVGTHGLLPFWAQLVQQLLYAGTIIIATPLQVIGLMLFYSSQYCRESESLSAPATLPSGQA